MRRLRFKKVRKAQQNQFEYAGIHTEEPVQMQLFVYNKDAFVEHLAINLDQIGNEIEKSAPDQVLWVNVHGLHNEDLIRRIGELIGIESYIIADVLNIARRTRMEELDDMLFFSIKSILQEQGAEAVRVEQISFLIRGNLLVSFQERKSDFFEHIRERIRQQIGSVRRKRNDYLLYLLLEAVMENFFITIENNEDKIEALIVDSNDNEGMEILELIEKNRENLNFLKRSIVPLRDALYTLKSMQDDDEFTEIEKSNYIFFTRLHQKSLELLDQIEYDMNSLESASNVFFSSQNQRMNQIMKTLTIFSVIFMPLTFIVGVYGMNFDNMPELRSTNGYYIVLAAMFVIAVGMVIYFRRKKWF